MKVGLIIERLEAHRGGAETSTLQFAGHLHRLGAAVHIITTSYNPSTPHFKVVHVAARAKLQRSRTLVFAARAAQHVAEHDYDIVHSITPCLAADVYQPRGGTIPETLARNVAIRKSAAGRWIKRLAQRCNGRYRATGRLERQLLSRDPAPWVIAISSYVRDQLITHYGLNGERVIEVFNGVDPVVMDDATRSQLRADTRHQFGLGDGDYVALCIAHNFKLKGVGPAIDALARLRAGNTAVSSEGRAGRRRSAERTYLLVVGRDNPRPYARRAARRKVGDRIIFAGPTQRIPAFLAAADVLVHPTYYDPCSRVALEAMTAGLPVITTKYNGAAERVTCGHEGYVLDDPADVDGLAQAIDRLADDGHRHTCGGNARASASAVTMEAHARGIWEVYERILAARVGEASRRRG